MNVLFLTQEFPPDTAWGGIGNSTRELAIALTQQGARVTVATSTVPPRATYTYTDEGIDIVRLKRSRFQVPVLRRLWFQFFPRLKHQWEYIWTVHRALPALIRQREIDLIEAPELWAEGLLYSYRRRVPIVVKSRSPLFLIRQLNEFHENLDWRLIEWFERVWTLRADRLAALSHQMAQRVAERYHLPLERFTIIPNPVDTERFRPPDMEPEGPPIILYVGRIEPRKGAQTLVAAMPSILADFPSARFLFLGRDVEVEGRSWLAEIQAEMRLAGVRAAAEFHDQVEHTRLGEFYRRSTVCVFPSKFEPLGNVCLEAMACGRAVVGSSAGGMAEVIQDGETGCLAPPGDPAAWAVQVKHLLAERGRRMQLGVNARRAIEQRYARAVIARRSLELYADTLSEWKTRHPGR